MKEFLITMRTGLNGVLFLTLPLAAYVLLCAVTAYYPIVGIILICLILIYVIGVAIRTIGG